MRDVGSGARLVEIHPAERVRERIDALAAALEADYAGRADAPLLVVIAEGAIRFAHGLAAGLSQRGLVPDVRVVRARRTFGTRLEQVELEELDPAIFRARHVIITDDIADEGRTLGAVMGLVRSGEPASVRVAVLVNKTGRRRVPLHLDYVGFELRDGWVVGYGMDLDGAFRDLDSLSIIEEESR
ncbi:MAG: phosphoribosyltransferase family protein [Myxococcota bacterium]